MRPNRVSMVCEAVDVEYLWYCTEMIRSMEHFHGAVLSAQIEVVCIRTHPLCRDNPLMASPVQWECAANDGSTKLNSHVSFDRCNHLISANR